MRFSGARLREARESLGLTQDELAKRVSASVETISRAERGKFSPRAGTVQLLAVALDIDPSDLFEAVEAPAA